MRFKIAVSALGLLCGFVKDGVEGRIEKASDKRSRRVVAAGGLSFVAARRLQGEGNRVGVEPGLQFEERLVDAAKFLGPQVAIIDAAADLPIADDGQCSDRFEQIGVGETAIGQIRCADRVEQAANGRQP